MKPEDALQEQIQRYQQMTGEQRLALALELHELSCEVARLSCHTKSRYVSAASS